MTPDVPVRAYARLPMLQRWRAPAPGPGATLFLDIDPGPVRPDADAEELSAENATILGYLRDVPAELLLPLRLAVLRWPHATDDPAAFAALGAMIRQHLDRRAVRAQVGFAVFRVGDPPRIEWQGEPAAEGDDVVLGACRRAETDAFLQAGHAVWRPAGYHYQFPSGKHGATFVRTADALREPRAAAALATWLYADLREGTTVLLDHGGLAPLAAELGIAAETSGAGSITRTVALDEYMSTLYQYRAALKGVDQTPVVALVSVSSTGGTVRRLRQALRDKVGDDFAVHVLVSRDAAPGDTAVVPVDPGAHRAAKAEGLTWTSLDDPPQDHRIGGGIATCALCREAARSPVVHIDPTGMRALLLPSPKLTVPDLRSARSNRGLWERYASVEDPRRMDYCNPIRQPGLPRRSTSPDPDRQMYFEPTHLASSLDTPDWVAKRVAELAVVRSENGVSREAVEACARVRSVAPTHLVLDGAEYDELWRQKALHEDRKVPEHEVDEHVREIASALLSEPTRAAVLRFDATSGVFLPEDPPQGLRAALIVAFGVHTGVTLQRTFLALRDRPAPPHISAAVFHAHPADPQTWHGIRNTFTDESGKPNVIALHLTYLPEHSPVVEERRVLRDVRPTMGEDVHATAQGRLNDEHGQTLWGPPSPELRPSSFLGQRLPAAETLAAVGAAMHATRVRAEYRAGPVWEKFNLQRAFRSYFDGLILAAILRWLRPQEAWWGDRPEDCADLLTEAKARLKDEDWHVLLPELLLAAAQGKVPAAARDYLLGEAQDLAAASPEVRPWLELGTALLRHADAPV